MFCAVGATGNGTRKEMCAVMSCLAVTLVPLRHIPGVQNQQAIPDESRHAPREPESTDQKQDL